MPALHGDGAFAIRTRSRTSALPAPRQPAGCIVISLPTLARSTTGHLPRRCVIAAPGGPRGWERDEGLFRGAGGATRRAGTRVSTPRHVWPRLLLAWACPAGAQSTPDAMAGQHGSRLQAVGTRGFMASCRLCCLIAATNRDCPRPSWFVCKHPPLAGRRLWAFMIAERADHKRLISQMTLNCNRATLPPIAAQSKRLRGGPVARSGRGRRAERENASRDAA